LQSGKLVWSWNLARQGKTSMKTNSKTSDDEEGEEETEWWGRSTKKKHRVVRS
jgi:hypothetical protein